MIFGIMRYGIAHHNTNSAGQKPELIMKEHKHPEQGDV